MDQEKSNRIKIIVKIVSFVLVTIALIGVVTLFLHPEHAARYSDERSVEANRIFDERENSIDVIFLGHSGVYSGISPMEIYKKYGFTSYDFSQARQLPWESLEMLKAVLKVQKPAVLVLETDQLFYDEGKNIAESFGRSLVHNFVPILKNHVAWKDWFNKGKKRERSITKGYKFSKDVKPFKGNKNWNPTDKAYKIKKSHLGPFKDICDLCKENDIPVLLLEVPSTKKWDYSKFNAVKKISEEKGLPFIDMNQILEEFGFDWETDSRDKGDHLNYSGAVKVSDYLGKYLQDTYGLVSRKGDEKYASWEEDLCKYEKMIEREVNKK